MWYIASQGRVTGPFSPRSVINGLLAENKDHAALVWKEGMAGWEPIEKHFPLPKTRNYLPRDSRRDYAAIETDLLSPVVKFWRGLYPLSVTFWIAFILGNILLLITRVFVFLYVESIEYNPYVIFSYIFSLWALTLSWMTFVFVGLKRSAAQYMHSNGWASIFKARAAITIVAISMIFWLGNFVFIGGAQLRESWHMAFNNDPDIDDFKVRIMRNGTEVEVSGGFKYGIVYAIEKALTDNPRVSVIHLNSYGGRIGEAQKLAKLIKQKQLITYTSSTCASACTISYAAGRERWLGVRGRLGYHAASFAAREEPQAMISALRESGIAPSFIDKAVKYNSKEMWYPTLDELLSDKIITGQTDSYRFAVSGLGRSPSGSDFTASLLAIPLFEAFREAAPLEFSLMIHQFEKGYRDGSPEGILFDDLRTKYIIPLIQVRAAKMDNSLAIDYSKLLADQYALLLKVDSAACFQYASVGSSSNIVRLFPKELLDTERALGERLIKSDIREVVIPKSVDEAYDIVMPVLLKTFSLADLQLLESVGTIHAEKYDRYCAVVAAMFREFTKLRPNLAGNVLRDIFSSLTKK